MLNCSGERKENDASGGCLLILNTVHSDSKVSYITMLGYLIKLLVAPRFFFFLHVQERNKTERSSTHTPSLIKKS